MVRLLLIVVGIVLLAPLDAKDAEAQVFRPRSKTGKAAVQRKVTASTTPLGAPSPQPAATPTQPTQPQTAIAPTKTPVKAATPTAKTQPVVRRAPPPKKKAPKKSADDEEVVVVDDEDEDDE